MNSDRGTVFHCSTDEKARMTLNAAHQHGYKWATGDSFATSPTEWGVYKEGTCYDLKRGKFLELSWCITEGYNIIRM